MDSTPTQARIIEEEPHRQMNRSMKGKGITPKAQRTDWETPIEFFKDLDKEFHFTLDPAASEWNAKCQKYYTEKENGLKQPWSGNVWLNPPYGTALNDWADKVISERDNCEVIVMLVPARTDTQWFRRLLDAGAEVRFITGRIKYEGSKANAPFPSILIILRSSRRPL